MYKTCTKCNLEQPKLSFYKNRATCRTCCSAQAKKWRHANTEKHNKYQACYKSHRYKNDLSFKIKHVLRARLYKAISSGWKEGSAVELLGCSIAEFKKQLESQFQPGMSWENWTKNGWHIDHKVPLDAFNLSDIEQLKKACHHTNLQPLWGEYNSQKSNKVLL